jgi:glutathione S-transferase
LFTQIVGPFYNLLMSQQHSDQEKARDELLSVLRGISAQYKAGPFFLGDRLSYADLHWYPWVHRLCVLKHYRNFEVPQTEEYAGFHRFEQAMLARPNVPETLRPAEFFIDAYKGYALGN